MNWLRHFAILFMGVTTLGAGEGNAPPPGVTIKYDTEGNAYYYMIMEGGEEIGVFASSYQPEKRNEQWSAAQTRSASWHWTDDGAAVAIEETNHRYIGTVILARRIYGAYEPVPLAISEFMARSGEKWDRCRLFFGGWTDNDRARIILTGRTGKSPGPYEFTQYEFSVDMSASGKIESCKKGDATHSEQGGAGQPATVPESKPEGNEKPKPESEGRPQ